MIAASAAIRYIAFSGGGIGFDWVNSWFEDSLLLPGDFVLHGSDVPSLCMIGGLLFVFLGVLGIVAATQRIQPSQNRVVMVAKSDPKRAPVSETIPNSVVVHQPALPQVPEFVPEPVYEPISFHEVMEREEPVESLDVLQFELVFDEPVFAIQERGRYSEYYELAASA